MRVHRRSTITSRGNHSRRFSQREQVRAYRIQLCIILVKQPAGARCASVMYLASTQETWREDWSGQSILITPGRTKNLRYPNVLNKKVRWVDIDEKWWDVLRKRAVKVYPGQQRQTRVATKSTRFVQKVMCLCAVVRPCGDFNGRLGMYRCARKRLRNEIANITNEGTCTTKTVRWTGTCSTR